MKKEKQLQMLEQLRRAVQIVTDSFTDEQALEVATVYPKYEVGKSYKAGDRFCDGVNGVGDPLLYKVLQDHTSALEWPPNATPSLYKAIGVVDGYDEWSQPTGAHDTYNKGDIVWYQDKLYISTVDGNAYAPGVVDKQWIIYEG